jgi:hypothetical protein
VASRITSEAFIISKRDCDPITKRIQKIVLQLPVFVSNSKILNLLDKMVPRFSLVYCRFPQQAHGKKKVQDVAMFAGPVTPSWDGSRASSSWTSSIEYRFKNYNVFSNKRRQLM